LLFCDFKISLKHASAANLTVEMMLPDHG